MVKTVDIGGKDIAFEANAYTPILYYRLFKRDLLREFSKADGEETDISLLTSDLAAVMALSHGKDFSELAKIDLDMVGKWLMSIENPLALIEKSDEIFEIWLGNQKSEVEPKKK